MAEKAVINSIFGLKKNANGEYVVLVSASVTGGKDETFRVITCEATSADILPILPTWQSRIKQAIIDAASSQYGIIVDDVLSTDFAKLL